MIHFLFSLKASVNRARSDCSKPFSYHVLQDCPEEIENRETRIRMEQIGDVPLQYLRAMSAFYLKSTFCVVSQVESGACLCARFRTLFLNMTTPKKMNIRPHAGPSDKSPDRDLVS